MIEKKQIEWIDITKGILITLVVLGHLSFSKELAGGLVARPPHSIEMIWGGVICWIYSCHIPGFFLVNGVLKNRTSYIEKGYTFNNLVSKQAKVIKYYIFFSSVFFLRYVFQALYGSNDWEDVAEFIYNTCTLVGMGVLWFLPPFVFSQFLFHYYVTGKGLVKSILIAFIFFSFVSSYLWGINNITDNQSVIVKVLGVISKSFIAFSFVVLGFYLDRFKLFETKLTFIGLISVLAFSNGLVDMNKLFFNNPILYYFFAITGFMLVVFVSKIVLSRINSLKSVFTLWGRESLFIMCTHTIFLIIHLCAFISVKITSCLILNITIAFLLTMLMESFLLKYYRMISNIIRRR